LPLEYLDFINFSKIPLLRLVLSQVEGIRGVRPARRTGRGKFFGRRGSYENNPLFRGVKESLPSRFKPQTISNDKAQMPDEAQNPNDKKR
jgi:hypothetical protein